MALTQTSITRTCVHTISCIVLDNGLLKAIVSPDCGGKIVSLRLGDTELLWNNPSLDLEVLAPGSAYDPNFFGGVDELLPNDEAEHFAGVDYPDHGELWTSRLHAEELPDGLRLKGELSQTGLSYEKTVRCEPGQGVLHMDYRITNLLDRDNFLLLKMHAALAIHAGDRLECPAKRAEVADADFTGRHGARFFSWPYWQGENGERDDVSIVPGPEAKRNEFLFLHELQEGVMTMRSPSAGTYVSYHFDPKVFPYAWYFASYGGWNDVYTAVLEPASAVPTRLSQSIADNTCTRLGPRQTLTTRVSLRAGRI